jgi:hypothetical protein
MSPSELKKLAKACRAAGISHFKNAEIEFTLTSLPDKPLKPGEKQPMATGGLKSVIDEGFEAEGLSQDQLLMWSANSSRTDEDEAEST